MFYPARITTSKINPNRKNKLSEDLENPCGAEAVYESVDFFPTGKKWVWDSVSCNATDLRDKTSSVPISVFVDSCKNGFKADALNSTCIVDASPNYEWEIVTRHALGIARSPSPSASANNIFLACKMVVDDYSSSESSCMDSWVHEYWLRGGFFKALSWGTMSSENKPKALLHSTAEKRGFCDVYFDYLRAEEPWSKRSIYIEEVCEKVCENYGRNGCKNCPIMATCPMTR